MELNLFDYFKHLGKTPLDPNNAYEQGSAFFRAGQLGERISPHLDDFAEKARVSRRTFMKSACGFAGAMLAVNKVTGMKFFEFMTSGRAGGLKDSEPLKAVEALAA